LREVLPVLQLDGRTAQKLGRRLRRVTRRLGALRELDVLLDVMDELQKSRRDSGRVLGQITGDIRTARHSAQDDLIGKPLVSELQRLGRKLEAAADELKHAERKRSHGRAWHWAIDARISRRATTVAHAIDEAGALYLPERLHGVRIALKKLRYAVEVGAEATGADRRADLKTLKRGQDLLGRMHDFQVLIDRMRRAQASPDPADGAVSRRLEGLDIVMRGLDQQCRRLHARYVRERGALAAVCARLVSRQERSERVARASRPAAVRRAG
jgi:CHAD domain-containing protein